LPNTTYDKVIGTVAGLEYTYTHYSQTLIISKTSGTFVAEDVAKVVEAIKLKNTDTDSQLGMRTATITYMDIVGNESASATASLKEAQRGFFINGESSGDFSGISVSNAGDVNGDLGLWYQSLKILNYLHQHHQHWYYPPRR
jgi:hypothetical protein